MSLPKVMSDIFKSKQKSYKMVLILSLLDELDKQHISIVPLNDVKERFLSFYQTREMEGLIVEKPPEKLAMNWKQITVGQLQPIISTPIDALSSILINDGEWIRFRPDVWEEMRSDVIHELRDYALKELDDFYKKLASPIPLSDILSKILSEYLTAKTQPFGKHTLGEFVRQIIPSQLRSVHFIGDQYKVQGSVGQGNWADIPWIAIMDPRITMTTQQGVYIVYLFSDDMSSVYLTLIQGVTEPLREGKKSGYQYLREKAKQIREIIPLDGFKKDESIHLTTKGIGEAYQVSTIAYRKYDSLDLPTDQELLSDLHALLVNYEAYVQSVISNNEQNDLIEKGIDDEEELIVMDDLSVRDQLTHIKAYIKQRGFSYPEYMIENFYLSLKTKPFVILAGISGTGKTKLVKLFAEALGATDNNHQFTLIPVRPDWSDPSDLLGYKDLSGRFRVGKLTEVLLEASKIENCNKPYFICLDEMNLARVEHYFSDLLSVLETQKWKEGQIVTDAILSKDTLNTGDYGEFNDNVGIPDNVFLIGTVNMDETTHPFSKKVLDRANTIEFNYVQLEDYPILDNNTKPMNSKKLAHTFLCSDYLQLQDAFADYEDLVKRTTEKLVTINNILEENHSHIGFRVRDAVCFYLIYNQRFGLMKEEYAFDFQLLQKILPRIQGSSHTVRRVLIELMLFCTGHKGDVEELMNDPSELYKTILTATYPQSARKLAYMLRRLEEDGFTSFWLS
ncbi:DUF3578 domain-containing protein [Paenibacillus sediminis]|uniref:MoxR-like ATPase n=1 Tax=Paenibacillus sediminis TaxID=664909 RepID=A0ABS4H4X1_9BACL|nr:DUF3578 domain-containing protein [Paenibacillus sediminis]MBP1937561.1 MoxR-like ATPase [Paenibacillus sediminis]